MKKLLFLLTLTLASCLQRPTFPCVITDIKSGDGVGNCRYFSISISGSQGIIGSFRDSCGKFNIGDTAYTSK